MSTEPKEYLVVKNFSIDNFLDLVGSTTLKPDYDGDHRIEKEEPPTDISQQCSTKNKYSFLVYYDISNESLKTNFPLTIKTKYYNAHNHQKREYQQYTMIHPIEHFDFKISFPKQKKYPQIHFLEAPNCYAEFVESEKPLKLFVYSPTDEEVKDLYQYAVENKDEYTVVWHIENPMVSRIYKIQWDWQYNEN